MDIDVYTDDLEYNESVNAKSCDNVIQYNNYFTNLMGYKGIDYLSHTFSNGYF